MSCTVPALAQGRAWAGRTAPRRMALTALVVVSLAQTWVLTACPVLRYTSGKEWLAGKAGRAALVLPFNWFPDLSAPTPK